MRILFLTNFYPPYQVGGQEQSCRQVVEGLKERGHNVAVLTSMHGTNNAPVEVEDVYRLLYLEMDLVPWRQSITFFTQRKQRERLNLQRLERVITQFEPDVVFVWGMWNLSWSLPAFVETHCPSKVVYRFADYWPTLPSQHELYWQASGRTWFSRLPKQVLGRVARALLTREDQRPALKFARSICVSAANREVLVEAGVPVSGAQVIHTGIDLRPYSNGQAANTESGGATLELLYAGRLSSEKGVDVAIKALAKLKYGQGLRGIRLSLAGAGLPEYEFYLRSLVAEEALTDCVNFLGNFPPEAMPALFHKYDVLLVPSIWPEPFARTVLEGMACGLVVVATPEGGTREIIVDGNNGLLFATGDADDLAQKVNTLAHNRALCRHLARAGQQTVKERFTFTRMLDEYERYLQEVSFATSEAALHVG